MSNKPTHTAYVVKNPKEGSDKEANWREIGAVWPHKDGEGFDLTLVAIPLDGRVVCRKRKPDETAE